VVIYRKPADIASLHVAIGALVLATTFTLTVISMRLYSPAWRTESARQTPAGRFEQEDLGGEVVPA